MLIKEKKDSKNNKNVLRKNLIFYSIKGKYVYLFSIR